MLFEAHCVLQIEVSNETGPYKTAEHRRKLARNQVIRDCFTRELLAFVAKIKELISVIGLASITNRRTFYRIALAKFKHQMSELTSFKTVSRDL